MNRCTVCIRRCSKDNNQQQKSPATSRFLESISCLPARLAFPVRLTRLSTMSRSRTQNAVLVTQSPCWGLRVSIAENRANLSEAHRQKDQMH